MTIVGCPRCGDQVVAPVAADQDAQVRCPLCHEEYAYSEVLAALPPALILLGESQSEFDSEPLSVARMSAMREREGGESSTDSGVSVAEFEFKTSPPPVVKPKKPPQVTIAAREPRRRKRASVEVFKVVVGGFLGLVIGQLILWWGLDRDLLELGPQVSRVAPWVVPEAFHGGSASITSREPDPLSELLNARDGGLEVIPPPEPVTDNIGSDNNSNIGLDDTGSDDVSTQETSTQENNNNNSAETTSEEAAPDLDASVRAADAAEDLGAMEPGAVASSLPATVGDSPEHLDDAPEPMTDPLMRPDTGEPEVAVESLPSRSDPFDEHTADGSVAGVDAIDSTETVGDAAPEAAELGVTTLEDESDDPSSMPATPIIAESSSPRVTIYDGPSSSVGELTDRVEKARLAAAAWDLSGEVSTQQKRLLAAALYRAFAQIGEVLAGVESEGEQVKRLRQDIAQLIAEIQVDDEKMELVRRAAPQWIEAKGTMNGVLLLGEVTVTRHVSEMYETEIQMQGGQSVSILTAHDPADELPPGQTAFVLGLIVENPSEFVDGYTGDAGTAIVNGLHVLQN